MNMESQERSDYINRGYIMPINTVLGKTPENQGCDKNNLESLTNKISNEINQIHQFIDPKGDEDKDSYRENLFNQQLSMLSEFKKFTSRIKEIINEQSGQDLKNTLEAFKNIHEKIQAQKNILKKEWLHEIEITLDPSMERYSPAALNSIYVEAKKIFDEVNLLEKLSNTGFQAEGSIHNTKIKDINQKLNAINNDPAITFSQKIKLARGCLLKNRKALGKLDHGKLAKRLDGLLKESAFKTTTSGKACMVTFNKKFAEPKPATAIKTKLATGPLNFMRKLFSRKQTARQSVEEHRHGDVQPKM